MKQVIKLSDGLDSKVYRMYFADVRKFGSQRLWDTLRDYYNTEDPRYVNSLLSSIMDDSKESVDILRNRSSKYSMFATTFFVGSLIGAFSIN
ncbi:hypothetical protein J4216_05070, partial [Candidatus Woesearchaeota archaeon]|nr:hypothetical protein [Candidatus Woesearchaeota archaeon]